MATKKSSARAGFQEGIDAVQRGDYAGAAVVLETAMTATDSVHDRLVVGNYLGRLLLFELKDADRAQRLFEALLAVKPDNEHASIGLFHSLWTQGWFDDAFEEAKRFVLLKPSKEYRRIVAEIMEGLEE